LSVAILTVLTLLGAAPPAGAGTPGAAGDTTADLVLGQIDFAHQIADFGGPIGLSGFDPASLLGGPSSVASDSLHIYAADIVNNRVLAWGYHNGFNSGEAAEIVIGQPDFYSSQCNTTQNGLCFYSPTDCPGAVGGGVAVDAAGNLYVADGCNSRVLEFDTPFTQTTTTGQAAHLVFGQGGSFTSNSNPAGCGSVASICTPTAITVDVLSDLLVVDRDQDRGLLFFSPLVKNPILPGSGLGATIPDLVVGTQGCGPAATASTLCSPDGIAADLNGNVYVADTGNQRVLEYNTPLKKTSTAGSGDTIADTVFGQSSLTGSSTCSAPSSKCLNTPTGISVDFSGNLYVADSSNNRVVEYNSPLQKTKAKGSGDNVADHVFGQKGFTTSTCSNGLVGTGGSTGKAGVLNPVPSKGGLCNPEGVLGGGDVLIADSGNARVLFYNSPLQADGIQGSGTTNAGIEFGQTTFSRNMDNGGGAQALSKPASVAVDAAGHVYVADSGNNRVLGWKSATALANGAAADTVIGQLGYFSYSCAATRSGLCLSNGCESRESCIAGGAVAVDPAGNLYVADTFNNRVLEYNAPFKNASQLGAAIARPANQVFGQNGKFTTNACRTGSQTSAEGLCSPSALAVDAAGNLYVADSTNNRVLEFNTPLTKTKIAGSGDTLPDRVFGQASATGSQCNQGAAPNSSSLCNPEALVLDSAGDLYVADFGNNRVLEYATPLATGALQSSGGPVADQVFGQSGSFSTQVCAGSGSNPAPAAGTVPLTADGLCGPQGVAVDATGNLYVSDTSNNRILEYENAPPVANPADRNTTAATVFGQAGSFTTGICSGGGVFSTPQFPPTADGLCAPNEIVVDTSGNLWAADTDNNRVLEFKQPLGAQPLSEFRSAGRP
jgi:sugar lactone lactonase YvrE